MSADDDLREAERLAQAACPEAVAYIRALMRAGQVDPMAVAKALPSSTQPLVRGLEHLLGITAAGVMCYWKFGAVSCQSQATRLCWVDGRLTAACESHHRGGPALFM